MLDEDKDEGICALAFNCSLLGEIHTEDQRESRPAKDRPEVGAGIR